jgi:prepilin-type N-terminal cleavage/methylation domain-containing protein
VTRRAAFTLIEVMVAIVVTGLVVTLAYGALRAGTDVQDSLERFRRGTESETIARALLTDAVRHALPGARGGAEVFVLENGIDVTGRPSDRLRFLTRGVVSPLGTSAAWDVSIGSDTLGLFIVARSTEDESQRVQARLRDVSGMDVALLPHGFRASWTDRWEDTDRSPVAVHVTFASRAGDRVIAPFVARVGFGGAP